MGREEQLLADSIRSTLISAQKALVSHVHASTVGSVEELDALDENPSQYEHILEYNIEKAFREVTMLAERMGLSSLSVEVRETRKSFKSLTSWDRDDDDSEARAPALGAVRILFESLQVMTNGSAVSGISILENILRNTAAIVSDRNLQPEKEKAVEKAMIEIVRYAFPDTVKNPVINKVMKNYKPEFGVRTLMTAVEYKFARTEADLLQCLDGVWSDMKGYAGSPDWRTFYAVFYTAGPIANVKALEEDWKWSGAGTNWIPILVSGPSAAKGSASSASSTAVPNTESDPSAPNRPRRSKKAEEGSGN